MLIVQVLEGHNGERVLFAARQCGDIGDPKSRMQFPPTCDGVSRYVGAWTKTRHGLGSGCVHLKMKHPEGALSLNRIMPHIANLRMFSKGSGNKQGSCFIVHFFTSG